jgi:hypothetical protein
MDIVGFVRENLLGGIDTNLLILRILVSVGIIILGVIFGKLVNFGLKRLFKKIELEKKIKGGILDLFRAIIRWSIYLVFLVAGLSQLGTTNLTKTITSVLIIIPTFVGALILIIAGFSIAYFLKRIISESGIKNVEPLSEVVFYFVIYLAGIYALKTALVSFGDSLTNYLIMILTAVFGLVGAYFVIKKNKSS